LGAGQRNEINKNDVRAMQKIKEILEITCSHQPLKAEITFIFTDICKIERKINHQELTSTFDK
jgi:hypothetical protein